MIFIDFPSYKPTFTSGISEHPLQYFNGFNGREGLEPDLRVVAQGILRLCGGADGISMKNDGKRMENGHPTFGVFHICFPSCLVWFEHAILGHILENPMLKFLKECLVGGLWMVYGTMEWIMNFPSYWEFHHPNWLSMTFIFFRWVETSNQKMLKFLQCPCFQYHGMLDDGWMIFMDFPYWESRHVKTHVVLRVKIFSSANPVKHGWHFSHKTYTHHKPWALKWC